ncbi:MAB_1171c family putative transporter [Streptomyces sp. CO7]
MEAWIYYIAAGALLLGALAQWPGLRALRHDPLKRAVAVVAVLGAGCFALGAPSTVTAINAISVPNAAAPVTYATVMAFSAASLSLMIQWRGGSSDGARRATRACTVAYTCVAVSLFALFAAGDAPVERTADLDTYYATAPFIREMIALYLVAHFVAALTTAVLCGRWSRHAHGWIRRSLILLCTGWISVTTYSVCKLTAVGARWAGQDWDELSTHVAPSLVALGTVFVMAGYALPTLGRRVESTLAFVRLRPLHRLVVPADGRFTVRLPGVSGLDAHLHLMRRVSAIRDGIHRLDSRLDARVQEQVYDDLRRAGRDPVQAADVALAAVVAVAARPGPAVPDAHRAEIPMAEASLVRLSRAVETPEVAAVVRAHHGGDVPSAF